MRDSLPSINKKKSLLRTYDASKSRFVDEDQRHNHQYSPIRKMILFKVGTGGNNPDNYYDAMNVPCSPYDSTAMFIYDLTLKIIQLNKLVCAQGT